jgi:hypothetical protein
MQGVLVVRGYKNSAFTSALYQKDCWENVKKAISKYKFPFESLTPYLVPKEVYRDQIKDAQQEQKFVDEVEVMSMVTRAPYKKHWMELMQYLCDNKNLFPEFYDNYANSVMKVVNMHTGR